MPTIASLADLKNYLDLKGTGDDSLLTSILEGVSQRVETYTGRVFHPVPDLDAQQQDTLPAVARVVAIPRPRSWFAPLAAFPKPRTLDIPDAREIDTVAFAGATVGAWQLLGDPPWRRLELFDPAVSDPPFTQLPAVTLTGRFGIWPAPQDIKDAVLTMAARRYRERDAGYADSVVLPDSGIATYFKQFPPTVQATLDTYVRQVRLT